MWSSRDSASMWSSQVALPHKDPVLVFEKKQTTTLMMTKSVHLEKSLELFMKKLEESEA